MYDFYMDDNGRPIKIALIGGARTGKDTIADYLVSVYDFKRLAFGDKLKELLYKTFPHLKNEAKPRKAMIDFGQACRKIDPLVWIGHLHHMGEVWKSIGFDNFVITDVRQENELKYCKEQGYIIVKVEAPREAQEERALATGEVLNVDNELDVLALNYNDYDYIVKNDGTIEDLYRKIESIFKLES